MMKNKKNYLAGAAGAVFCSVTGLVSSVFVSAGTAVEGAAESDVGAAVVAGAVIGAAEFFSPDKILSEDSRDEK